MADYYVREEDGTSKFILEDGSGDYLLEAQSVVTPGFIASVTSLHAPTLNYTGTATLVQAAGTYTWVCPAGVSTVYVYCIGGGGPGGSNVGAGGAGGGGGGAFAGRAAVPVTPGTVYTFTVGAGGTSGGTGGDSSFTGDSSVQIIAKGGSAGSFPNTGPTAGGGTAGQASGSTGDSGLVFSGGDGGNEGNSVPGSGGGGGGASGNYLATGAAGSGPPNPNANPGGTGGTGANGGGSGGTGGTRSGTGPTPGSAPGGGGGGGGGAQTGAAGADGNVYITTQVLVGFIGSVTVVYGPTIPILEPSFISSVTVVYAPTIPLQVTPPFISSVTVVYTPALPEVQVPFIGSRTHVWTPFSEFDPNLTFGGPGNGGESWLIRLNANGMTETATLALDFAAAGVSTISLTGDSGLPSDKPFVVTIDDEVILVFQIAPGNYHIRLRALSNSAASSHTAGADVTWGDSYDMAITAGTAIADSFTADINSTGSFTYPGWLLCFDSSQAYNAAGDRYPMHVAQMLGVFDAGAGSSGTNRCDGAQPSAIHTAAAVSDDCPAALTNPARISSDINVGDVAVVRYTNPESYVLDLGGRSTALQSWFGLKRVDTSDGDVTFTDPNGIVVDTTGTYDTFTGSVNGQWANPIPLVTGIAPDASDAAGVEVDTPNTVPYTTVTLPASDRHFTRTAIGEKGWPMCCLSVRQGNRRVPFWQSWDWHNYAYVYDGFGTDCTYAQILINRNGIVFGSVPSVDLPNDSDIDGPDAVWDDGTYDVGASWYVALFNTPYIVFGPPVGGSIPPGEEGGGEGIVPGVGFGPGTTPGPPSIIPPPPVEGGSGGGIEQPPIGLHVWQTS